jgi:hypothetical protein
MRLISVQVPELILDAFNFGTLDVSRKVLLVLRGTETQAHSLALKRGKKDEKYVPKEADEKKSTCLPNQSQPLQTPG